MDEPQIIVGVDPGKTTGISTVKVWPGAGDWTLTYRQDVGPASDNDGLAWIYDLVQEQCAYANALAMEQLMAYGVTSQQEKPQAQGVVRLASYHCHVETFTYSPTTVRYSVVGHGRAKEIDVKTVLRGLTGLYRIRPAFSVHQMDALAVALCHCLQVGLLNALEPMKEVQG